MDINQLPLEILHEILSYLSYRELKAASTVCQHWNQVSGTLLVRDGKLYITRYSEALIDLEVVRNSTRKYQCFSIVWTNWEQLEPVVSECIQRFPNARKLHLDGVLQDDLDRFYQAFRSWMERLEYLEVSLKGFCRRDLWDQTRPAPADFSLTLPNLNQLYWKQSLGKGQGGKTITIDAPGLEYVYITDSSSTSAVLRIPCIKRIKFIRCEFFKTHFDDIFVGDFDHVETLILDIKYNQCNVSCLSKMPQLRYLSLRFRNNMSYLQKVDAMPSSKLLEILSIEADNGNAQEKTLNLRKVTSKFENLKILDLCGINVEANDEIQAEQLVFLKFRKITCSNSVFSVSAPKMRTLSLEVDMLDKLQLIEDQYLSKLFVDLEDSNHSDPFGLLICPFLKEHKQIKHLTLIEDPLEDDATYDRIVENVKHLELYKFEISINFFRLLAGWKSLKSLKLDECTIDCSEMEDDVFLLPGVEQLIIDCVELIDTSRTDFPILLANGTNEEIVNYDDQMFTMKTLIDKEYKCRPFSCPEIDPVSEPGLQGAIDYLQAKQDLDFWA